MRLVPHLSLWCVNFLGLINFPHFGQIGILEDCVTFPIVKFACKLESAIVIALDSSKSSFEVFEQKDLIYVPRSETCPNSRH
ncbi:MAG: hypothetical protein ACYCPW_02125 [Nitrososphaerales archaeon]